MVNTGKPSKGCFACRDRRVKVRDCPALVMIGQIVIGSSVICADRTASAAPHGDNVVLDFRMSGL